MRPALHSTRGDTQLSKKNDPVTAYVASITAAWTKSVDAILAVASSCAKADAELSAGDKAKLIAALPFKAPTFSKLVQIGNDTRLPDIRHLLSASYSSIYAVTQLSTVQLKQGIAKGEIHPGSRREDIEALRGKTFRHSKATLPIDLEPKVTLASSAVSWSTFAELRISSDFPSESRSPMERDLLEVAERYGAKLVRRYTPHERAELEYTNSMTDFIARWEHHGRVLVRKRIRELKKTFKASKKPWAFASDETHVDPRAGWSDLEEVLSIVGLEDEFDAIRAKAEVLAEAPDLPLGEDYAEDVEFDGLPPPQYPRETFKGWH